MPGATVPASSPTSLLAEARPSAARQQRLDYPPSLQLEISLSWEGAAFGPSGRDARHFTQSGGLIAIHPIVDALAGEFAVFASRLRTESFVQFGHDPKTAFSTADDSGFAGSERAPVLRFEAGCSRRVCEIIREKRALMSYKE